MTDQLIDDSAGPLASQRPEEPLLLDWRRMHGRSGGLQQAATQAFMAAELQVQGDINELMALVGPLGSSGLSTADQQAIVTVARRRLREMTAA